MTKKTILIFFIILVLVVPLVGYAGFATTKPEEPVLQAPQTVPVTECDVDQSISAPGMLINRRSESVEMPVEGKLSDIYVQPGSRVKAGDPLAKLTNPESYTAQAARLELDVLQAQAELDKLRQNAPGKQAQLTADLIAAQEALKKAETSRAWLDHPRATDLMLEKATSDLLQAEEGYAAAKDFYASKSSLDVTDPERASALDMLVAAKQQLDRARININWYKGKPSPADIAKADADVSVARAKVADIQSTIDRLKDGVDPIEEAQAKAKLADAQAKLAEAKKVQADGEIRAPFDGVVLAVSARTGATLQAGTAILTLSDPKALEVKANITEEDFPLVSPGMAVELFFDARPDLTLTGKVDRIVPKRVEGDRPLYNIYISLDEVPDGLVDGMTADTSVTIARREAVLCLPRAVVRASGGNKSVVKVWNGLQTENREIELGLRGDAYIEILSGLKKGDQVVSK